MVNLTDILVIATALGAVLAAIILLRPQIHLKDVIRIREIRLNAEAEQERLGQIIETIQHGSEDSKQLTAQLKQNLTQVNQTMSAHQAQATQTEQAAQRVIALEQEIRQQARQLDTHIQNANHYWNDKLDHTIETVRQVQTKLATGLKQVDESLLRLRDQEKMAQGFTQHIISYQKEQVAIQHEHMRLATDMSIRLESLLKDSNGFLGGIQQQSHRADNLFKQFCAELQTLEQQAQNQFGRSLQDINAAQSVVVNELEHFQQHLSKWEEQETKTQHASQLITTRYEAVKDLKVERLVKTVELTDEMCIDLQAGLENAHKLLRLLENKTQQVIQEVEQHEVHQNPNPAKEKGAKGLSANNLVNLQAYR